MDNSKLTEYMNVSIEKLVESALKASLKNPREAMFIMKYSMDSNKAKRIRIRHENNNEHIPPFLIASITTNCNLFCNGCYSRENNSCNDMSEKNVLSAGEWDNIFLQASNLGISFILLAGGEPLLRKEIVEKAAKYKNIVFPVFTNGTLIDDEYLKIFNKNRNLVPILSIEGDKDQTDSRRGEGTFEILNDVMRKLNNNGILFGSSITVTTENINTVTSDDFIGTLSDNGCKIVFYVEYVPVTHESKHLAPSDKERDILCERQNILRGNFSEMIFISFPGDEKYTGGCLAAGRGFFHINSDGSAEPCPFSPYSDMNLRNNTLSQVLKSPLFKNLKDTGMLTGEHSGSCTLFEKEEEVKNLLKK